MAATVIAGQRRAKSHISTSQPVRRAYEDSVRLDTGEIVTGLREILGAQLVAYLGRVSNTRSVREGCVQ